MISTTKTGKTILLTHLIESDWWDLHRYLDRLSEDSRRRFGPHAYDLNGIASFFTNDSRNLGYIARSKDSNEIIGYALIRWGYLVHDAPRLSSYGLSLSEDTDCVFAPSVADAWQSCGVGHLIFQFIREELRSKGINRMILWGGVQADNTKAVSFYLKNGFQTIGKFSYNGENLDMIAII